MNNIENNVTYVGIDIGECTSKICYNESNNQCKQSSTNSQTDVKGIASALTNKINYNKQQSVEYVSNTLHKEQMDMNIKFTLLVSKSVLLKRKKWYPNNIIDTHKEFYCDSNTTIFDNKKKTHEFQDNFKQRLLQVLKKVNTFKFKDKLQIAASIPSYYGIQQRSLIKACC